MCSPTFSAKTANPMVGRVVALGRQGALLTEDDIGNVVLRVTVGSRWKLNGRFCPKSASDPLQS